jgi:hypothetical protein
MENGYVIVFLVVYPFLVYLHLRSIHRTLSEIPKEYRALDPGDVWLGLIPLFSIFWFFKILIGLKTSFESLDEANRLSKQTRAGFVAGLVCATASVTMLVVRFSRHLLKNNPTLQELWSILTLFGGALFVVYFLAWLIHWGQLVFARKYIVK